MPEKPSEAEIIQLIQEAARQYEEYLKVVDLTEKMDEPEPIKPKYSWSNPIGLVLTDN